MPNGIKGQKTSAENMFINFSEILSKGVKDADGRYLGDIWEVSVRLGDIYPKLDELIIRKGFINRTFASIPVSAIKAIEDDIIVDTKADDVKFACQVKGYDFLVRRDILDQQVVDTYNHKVRRVNDIHLLKVDHELMIAHVEIGLRGIIRRLGWEAAVDLAMGIINKNAAYLKSEELVSWKYIQPVSINPSSMTMKLSVSEKQILSIPPADLGDMIFDLNVTQRMALFRTLDVKTKAKIFENLEFEEQKTILKELDKKEAAHVVTHMSSDEAADLLEKLPHHMTTNILTLIESNMAKKLSSLLGYSSDSAGGLMTMEFVAIQETMSVADAIEHIKNNTREFDVVPFIYLVDDKNHLKGVTTVRRLLFEDGKEAVLKTAFPKTFYVYLSNSVREVAFLMDKYKISSIPVIDENRVLHGVISMDDVLSRVISIAWRKSTRKRQGL